MSNEPEPESERILKRQERVDLTTAVADDDDEEVHPFGQGDIDDITASTQPQGAPPSYEATTGAFGAKQQSLIQKCKIFLELLNDPAVNGGKAILADDVESNIAILSADPPEDANVIAKTLMIKLKECMVQLGDLINLQNQSQIRALGDYLDAAKEVIESLNGPKFEDEKKALDEAQCDSATMSEEVCQAKLKAAIERVNTLKTNILKSIQEKKDGLAGFDTRKQNIEEIKGFFETIQFNESLTPEKITELKTKAGELKDKEGQDANEQNILKELISNLENLNQKLGEVATKKEDLKELQEQTDKLTEELSQVAAQQAQTEAKIATQQTSMTETVDTGAQVEGEPPTVVEEQGGETPTVVEEQGGEPPTVVEEQGGEETPTVAQVEGEEPPTVAQVEGEEPPTVVEEQGGEETPTVAQEEGGKQSIDSDQGTDEEVATALEGQKLEDQRMQSDDSLTSGDTASTDAQTPPPPIVDSIQTSDVKQTQPIATGDSAGMVKEAREEQIKIVQDQIDSLIREKQKWAKDGRKGDFSKDEELDKLVKKRDDIQGFPTDVYNELQGTNPYQPTGGKRKKRRRKSRKSQKGGKKKSKKRRSKKNKK